MSEPYRVLTVCTGNICRSPIAEVVLRDRFAAAGLGNAVEVASAGISGEEEGNDVDPRAVRVLRGAGYEVPHRGAHRVSPAEIAEQDLLLPMTARHARHLRTAAPDDASAERVRMYRSFDPAAPRITGPHALADEAELDIADPWYGGMDEFVAVLEEIEAGADGVVEHVREALAAREG